MRFAIKERVPGTLARRGRIETAHGVIETPAFVGAATKATVKTLTPAELRELGCPAVLGNTYHLYLQPGDALVREAGGVGAFMNWAGPTVTDSGGFQVFSLGAAFGEKVSKLANVEQTKSPQKARSEGDEANAHGKLVTVDEEGVTFRSHIDGSSHRFTPERSMQIQTNLGADIIFAFDECTSPAADKEYQPSPMCHHQAG